MLTTTVPTDLGKSLGKVEKTAVMRTAVPTPSNTLSNTHARIKLHSDGSKFTNLEKQKDSSGPPLFIAPYFC
jgi:hypothetical protein